MMIMVMMIVIIIIIKIITIIMMIMITILIITITITITITIIITITIMIINENPGTNLPQQLNPFIFGTNINSNAISPIPLVIHDHHPFICMYFIHTDV